MAKTKTTETEMNEVILRGSIVHAFSVNKWASTTIAVSSNNNRRNFPEVFWYDELAEKTKEFKEGDRVTIKGILQTSKKYRSQSIVGSSIEITPRELMIAADIDKGPYLADNNVFYLKGKLLRRYTPKGREGKLAIITLQIKVNGRTYFPQVVCFERVVKQMASIEDGKTICVKGYTQTDKKEHGGEMKYYQSYVADLVTEI